MVLCPTTRRQILPAIEHQLLRADLLITSGGVSMGGEHDVVKDTLSRLGTIRFRKVAMQPGMPQGFGTIGEDSTPIFTLPGNPVSAYVSFQIFVLTALGALQGQPDRQLPSVQATVTGPLRSPPGGGPICAACSTGRTGRSRRCPGRARTRSPPWAGPTR